MALLSASDFTGYSDSLASPANSSDVIFSGSVDLIFKYVLVLLSKYLIVFLLRLNAFITWKVMNYIPFHLMRILLLSI